MQFLINTFALSLKHKGKSIVSKMTEIHTLPAKLCAWWFTISLNFVLMVFCALNINSCTQKTTAICKLLNEAFVVVCTCVHSFVHLCVSTFVCMRMYIFVCIHVCVHVRVHMHMHMCVSVCM